jgi:HemY protein
MTRLILTVLALALGVTAATWIAAHPGSVSIEWEHWQVDTSVAALLAVLVLALIAGRLAWRLIRWALAGPLKMHRHLRERRKIEGQRALTLGLVAVAAGESAAALKHAKIARQALDNTPLTALLSAQAADLAGDDEAAIRHYEAMLDQDETALLARRGLYLAAVKSGDRDRALVHAEGAASLHPGAAWVTEALIDLYERRQDWQALDRLLGRARPGGEIDGRVLAEKRALVALSQHHLAERSGDLHAALAASDRALDDAPEFLPAILAKARALVALGELPKAAKLIERNWAQAAHRDLAQIYAQTLRDLAPLAQVKRFEKLAKLAPDAAISHLALAESARAATLWGEARRHFSQAAELDPHERAAAYLGLAELEEAEHHDPARAHMWREKAAQSPAASSWSCGVCGSVSPHWNPVCDQCGSVGQIAWSAPKLLPAPADAQSSPLRPGAAVAMPRPIGDRRTLHVAPPHPTSPPPGGEERR